MPWGHPGEHHDFEPQRHDDGYLEVIGFTMTSLVSGWHGACLEPWLCFVGLHRSPHSAQEHGPKVEAGYHQASLLWLRAHCLLLYLT